MKILIFGGKGMLGHTLVGKLKENFKIFTTFHGKSVFGNENYFFKDVEIIENFEAEDYDRNFDLIEKIKPDVMINCIGIIKQVSESNNVVKTLTVNSIFPQKLSEIAEKLKIKLITISTDCVFSGKKGNYTEEDLPDAFDLYGRSKLFGEVKGENCLTLRTSIIGRELETSHGLVEWFISQNNGKVKGFKNAIFSGFPTVVLSEIISDVIKNFPNLNGLYHISSEPINKYELLRKIRDEFKLDIEIEPFEAFFIDRSLNSSKFGKATGFVPKNWDEMIRLMAENNEFYRKIL